MCLATFLFRLLIEPKQSYRYRCVVCILTFSYKKKLMTSEQYVKFSLFSVIGESYVIILRASFTSSSPEFWQLLYGARYMPKISDILPGADENGHQWRNMLKERCQNFSWTRLQCILSTLCTWNYEVFCARKFSCRTLHDVLSARCVLD